MISFKQSLGGISMDNASYMVSYYQSIRLLAIDDVPCAGRARQ